MGEQGTFLAVWTPLLDDSVTALTDGASMIPDSIASLADDIAGDGRGVRPSERLEPIGRARTASPRTGRQLNILKDTAPQVLAFYELTIIHVNDCRRRCLTC